MFLVNTPDPDLGARIFYNIYIFNFLEFLGFMRIIDLSWIYILFFEYIKNIIFGCLLLVILGRPKGAGSHLNN